MANGQFPSADARLCGVIHLAATPGSAGVLGKETHAPKELVDALLETAVRDARAYVEGGISSLIVENFQDAPFLKQGVGPATIAALTLAVDRVSQVPGVSEVGVNVLRNDAHTALGIAAATGAGFIRVNVHTGAMYTDQGLIEGTAAGTLMERSRLGLSVRIFADVHVKHATPIAGERLEDAAKDAVQRGRADALIVSGSGTGAMPNLVEIARVKDALGGAVPVLIGSGFRADTARELLSAADGAIVGTAAKVDGDVRLPVDPVRVAALVAACG